MDLSGADADSDGYYGTAFYGTDCNDTNASINPGAAELCNSLDDNCAGKIDEGAQTTFYKDSDGDGDGQAGATALACSVPSGYAANSGDCNDANAAINPGAKEACNSIDDNCDGTIDEGAQTTFYKDGDGDGYGQTGTTTLACIVPSGYAAKSGDCNAADTAVYPGALEACDSKDNNCDGLTDEGVQTTFYRDADGDGYGVGTVTRLACTAPTGYASESGDCDDSDPAAFPDATETCNGKDDNCNGAIDDNAKTTFYADSDGDGYGDSVRPADACAAPTGYVTDNSDCNDADRNTHPGALEVCDGRDNNCDATIDEGVQTTYYQDADGDTYGNAAVTKSGCERPVGYAASSADCDDTSASIHPGATESCNSIDDNCDGQTDDGVKTRFYADTDDDGYGDDQNTIDSCSRLQGYVSVGGDCNDQASAIYPGAPETCDGLDEDCDGQIDEDVQTTFYADSDGDNYGDPQNAMQGCQPPEGYLDSDTDCNDTARTSIPELLMCAATASIKTATATTWAATRPIRTETASRRHKATAMTQILRPTRTHPRRATAKTMTATARSTIWTPTPMVRSRWPAEVPTAMTRMPGCSPVRKSNAMASTTTAMGRWMIGTSIWTATSM